MPRPARRPTTPTLLRRTGVRQRCGWRESSRRARPRPWAPTGWSMPAQPAQRPFPASRIPPTWPGLRARTRPRSLTTFRRIPPPPKPAPPIHRADAGVVRLQTRRACAILRVRKERANGPVGARVGGGGLVYVGDAERGWANALEPVLRALDARGLMVPVRRNQRGASPPRRRRVVSPAPRADALARGPPLACPADDLSLPRPRPRGRPRTNSRRSTRSTARSPWKTTVC